VSLLVVGAVGASAFGLQAAGLHAPSPANRAAARAASWLSGYRYVTSEVEAHGRTLRGRCFHGWFDGDRGRREERGTLLLLSNGGSIRVLRSGRILSAGSFMPSAIGALEVAGCTDVLGPRLATLAEFDAGIRARPAWLAGRRVVGLHARHLLVLVTPRTDRPLGVLLHGVKSRLQLRRLTPSLSRRLQSG